MDPLAFLAGAAAAAGACAAVGVPFCLKTRRLAAQLRAERHAASHDPLTGLPNRRAFYQRGTELVADASHYPLVAVVFDVDGFKQINDVYGHSAGDEVLVTTARRLAQTSGLVARLGGDEFAALLPVGQGSPHEQADRLAEALAAPMRLADRVVTVSVSVGLVPVEPGAHLADAIHRADAAMYRAKGARRRVHLGGQHVVHTTIRLAKPRHAVDNRPTTAT